MRSLRNWKPRTYPKTQRVSERDERAGSSPIMGEDPALSSYTGFMTISDAGIVVVPGAVFLDLTKAGITARSKVTTVGKALLAEPPQGFRGALFGPDSPAVVVNDSGVAFIGLPVDAAWRFSPELSRQLGKDVVTATLSSEDHSYSWTIDTAQGQVRRLVTVNGTVTEDSGTPAPEEAGIHGLDATIVMELMRRRTGMSLTEADVAIPVDLGGLASLLEPPSWRESYPQSVQDDMDAVLDPSLDLATQLLEKYGFIRPYAWCVLADGTLTMVGVSEDFPDTLSSLGFLWTSLKVNKDTYRTTAVTADMTVDGADAVGVQIEHRDGPAIKVFLPYQKSRFRGKYTYGELFAAPDERHIWPA